MNGPRPEDRHEPELDAFVARVMAGVADMAAPTPPRTFAAALRRGSMREAGTALASAWHVATLSGTRIAPRARMRSLALVLSIAALLAMGGSLAAAAAMRIVEHRPIEQGTVIDDSMTEARDLAPIEMVETDGDRTAPADSEAAEPEDQSAPPEDDVVGTSGDKAAADADEEEAGSDESEAAENDDDRDADEARPDDEAESDEPPGESDDGDGADPDEAGEREDAGEDEQAEDRGESDSGGDAGDGD